MDYVEKIEPVLLPDGKLQLILSLASFNELRYAYEKYISQKEASRKCMQNKKKSKEGETSETPTKERQVRRHKVTLQFETEKLTKVEPTITKS
jgi:hypothetical protein